MESVLGYRAERNSVEEVPPLVRNERLEAGGPWWEATLSDRIPLVYEKVVAEVLVGEQLIGEQLGEQSCPWQPHRESQELQGLQQKASLSIRTTLVADDCVQRLLHVGVAG